MKIRRKIAAAAALAGFLIIAGSRAAVAAPVAPAAPPATGTATSTTASATAAAGTASRTNATTLVLIQLQGGNDGLNAVVPYADPAYYAARPTLAIARTEVLPLNTQLGLNPALRPLLADWQAHDLAIVLGVGYPDPNRSHFRATDIWETASTSDEILDSGWITRMLPAVHRTGVGAADGVVISGLGLGPLRGTGIKVVSMNDPVEFVREAKQLDDMRPAAHAAEAECTGTSTAKATAYAPVPTTSALSYITGVESELGGTAKDLAALERTAPALTTTFPKTAFGRQMEDAARLILLGAGIPVLKVEIGGFDTHWDERARQDAALAQFADGVQAFRAAMIKAGTWNDVLLVTYSEFGRRVGENGSGGTDHGTAEPVLLLGGTVNGGFYGSEPSLTALDAGDLVYTTDFRSVYYSIGVDWWGLPRDAGVAALFPGMNPSTLQVMPFVHVPS